MGLTIITNNSNLFIKIADLSPESDVIHSDTLFIDDPIIESNNIVVACLRYLPDKSDFLQFHNLLHQIAKFFESYDLLVDTIPNLHLDGLDPLRGKSIAIQGLSNYNMSRILTYYVPWSIKKAGSCSLLSLPAIKFLELAGTYIKNKDIICVSKFSNSSIANEIAQFTASDIFNSGDRIRLNPQSIIWLCTEKIIDIDSFIDEYLLLRKQFPNNSISIISFICPYIDKLLSIKSDFDKLIVSDIGIFDNYYHKDIVIHNIEDDLLYDLFNKYICSE